MLSETLVSVLLFLIILLLFFMNSKCKDMSNETEKRAFESMLHYAELLVIMAFLMSLASLFNLF